MVGSIELTERKNLVNQRTNRANKNKVMAAAPKLKEAAKITDGASTDPTVADLVNSFLSDG